MRRQRSSAEYLSQDTIAAICSETGGAIAIIRVSGPKAFAILDQVTRTPSAGHQKMVRARLFKDGQILDDILFVRFQNPQSFTGEDLVEYHIHGSSFLAQRVLELLITYGARQALPGEFSFRAVRNGKMTLFQAQAVIDLLGASNDPAIFLANEKMSGLQNQFLNELASSIRKIAALSEIGIDFSDQDLEEVSLAHLKKQLSPLRQTLEKLKETYQRGTKLQEGIRVAFLGLPNAGKSSFFNAILGENRSIVSEVAGTTRDIVHEKLTLRGKSKTITLRLEDTAGFRTTEHPIEKIGIEKTLESAQKADLILLVVDSTSSLPQVNENFPLFSTPLFTAKTLGILTKSDLANEEQIRDKMQRGRQLGIEKWTITSALTGEGIQATIEAMVEFCERWTTRNPGELVLTRLEHLSAVDQALAHLLRASTAAEIDLFASDIRQALFALGPLIGETLPDDILESIFSNFCIGK